MFADLKHHARYWGFLLLKFAGAAFGSGFALWFLNLFWAPHTRLFHLAMGEFSFDLLYTSLVGVWFQFSFGLVHLAIRDQRYRCRTCRGSFACSIETGSWGTCCSSGRLKSNISALWTRQAERGESADHRQRSTCMDRTRRLPWEGRSPSRKTGSRSMKLPLWRLILAVLVLAAMVAVSSSLMPVYFENYHLGQYVWNWSAIRKSRTTICARRSSPRQDSSDLPVQPSDVRITHTDGKLQLRTKYVAHMDFSLNQVYVHLSANAASR